MSSGAAVSNPAEWHIYPAGAHHKLTECSPSLHTMIDQHRFDLNLPDANEYDPGYIDVTHQWIVKPEDRPGGHGLRWVPINTYEAWQDGWTKATHAAADDLNNLRQQIMDMGRGFDERLEKAYATGKHDGNQEARKDIDKLTEAWWLRGRNLGREEGMKTAHEGHKAAEQLRAYWTTGERSAPMFSRIDQSPPAMNEAQAPIPPAPSAPQASHKCARAMLIVHNDGAETMVNFDNPIAQRGWKFRNINGVAVLVIGHGVPRRHIPLVNVKFMDLLSEDEL